MIKKDWNRAYRDVTKHCSPSALDISVPLLAITCCKPIIKSYKRVLSNLLLLMAVFGLLIHAQ